MRGTENYPGVVDVSSGISWGEGFASQSVFVSRSGNVAQVYGYFKYTGNMPTFRWIEAIKGIPEAAVQSNPVLVMPSPNAVFGQVIGTSLMLNSRESTAKPVEGYIGMVYICK